MRIACFCICLFLSACTVAQQPLLPVLHPVSADVSAEDTCKQAFVGGDWQFVHSITFTMHNGHGSTLVGVTILQEEKLRTVLMGVEGFVLFEAEQPFEGKPVVKKAVPPFNKAGFAEGLMADVQTPFLEPVAVNRLFAENIDGELVCRYSGKNNRVTDVMTAGRRWNRITHYDAEGMVQQVITARQYRNVDGESLPQQMELISTGPVGYTLHLELLRADKL